MNFVTSRVIGSMMPSPAELLLKCLLAPFMCFGWCLTLCCGRCCSCRCRDIRCVKRCCRCLGVDSFDDFLLTILVHDLDYENKQEKKNTYIRITSGAECQETDVNSQGIFQQTLQVFVEQGTEMLLVEVISEDTDKTLAKIEINVATAILAVLQKGDPLEQKAWQLTATGKQLRKPRLTMSMHLEGEDYADEETGLLTGIGASGETNFILRKELEHCPRSSEDASKHTMPTETQVIASASKGPLDMFQADGRAMNVYVAVHGPPTQRKWTMGVWRTEKDFEESQRPIAEIDLTKVRSIQPDPQRSNVFDIHYYNASRDAASMLFRRIDRSRDVWVEMLQLLVKHVLEEKAAKKGKK